MPRLASKASGRVQASLRPRLDGLLSLGLLRTSLHLQASYVSHHKTVRAVASGRLSIDTGVGRPAAVGTRCGARNYVEDGLDLGDQPVLDTEPLGDMDGCRLRGRGHGAAGVKKVKDRDL